MDLDKFIKEEFVPFRERVVEGVQARHPHMFTAINTMLSGKENKMGLQVVEAEKVAGEYTFHLNGIYITSVDSGQLLSEIHHPMLGVIRPYAIVERKQLERMIQDKGFFDDLAATIPQYLPGVTIKFMQ
ncbi:MAG: hypothetical protein ABFC84_01095 [Veillonellales bacterium]